MRRITYAACVEQSVAKAWGSIRSTLCYNPRRLFKLMQREIGDSVRLSGCLAVIVVSLALFLVAGFCSLTSFSLAQQTVVDLNAAGMAVDDPLLTLALRNCQPLREHQRAGGRAALGTRPMLDVDAPAHHRRADIASGCKCASQY